MSSYVEFVTVLFGWVMYDRLWQIINDTGLVYAPFIAIVLRHVIEARKGGDDEGSAGIQSLKRIETDVVVALLVLVVAVIPFYEVRLGEMDYVRPRLDCGVAARMDDGTEPGQVNGTATGTTYDGVLATLGGERGRAPIWWAFVHVLSKAVVSAGVASVPCSADIAGVSMALANAKVDDEALLVEVEDFRRDCHQTVAQCARQGAAPCLGALGAEYINTRGWMGSSFFVRTPGFYDSFRSSRDRRPEWVHDPIRDAGLEGAHPRCREWWLDGVVGLRAKLLAALPAEVMQEMVYANQAVLKARHPGLADEEYEDLMLREFLGVRVGQRALSYDTSPAEEYEAAKGEPAKGVFAMAGEAAADILAGGAAAVGGLIKAPGNLAAGMAIRDGMPVFVSLLLMVFVVVLPFLMLFGRYDIGMLMTLTLVFFAIQFVYVLWGVAFWVDNQFAAALGAGTVDSWVENPTQMAIVLWLQRLMYIAFPMVWITSLTWVGVRVGDAFAQVVSKPMEAAAAVAQSGGDLAGSVAARAAGGAGRGGGR